VVEIRPLAHADRSGAVELWHRCGLTRPWNPPETDFDRAAAGAGSAVLGGFVGGCLAATAMVGHDGHRGWVYYLAVDPDRRRAGLGRAIMAAAEQWVRDAGIPKMQLMVRADNREAAGFYGALGFAPEDTTVLSRWLDGGDPV
jgi:ribosomal protein S18 acetylase RimI-like enzyme